MLHYCVVETGKIATNTTVLLLHENEKVCVLKDCNCNCTRIVSVEEFNSNFRKQGELP